MKLGVILNTPPCARSLARPALYTLTIERLQVHIPREHCTHWLRALDRLMESVTERMHTGTKRRFRTFALGIRKPQSVVAWRVLADTATLRFCKFSEDISQYSEHERRLPIHSAMSLSRGADSTLAVVYDHVLLVLNAQARLRSTTSERT